MTLAEDLRPLRPEYMAAPFWFWNDVMDPEEVRRQVREMAAQHMGGFFMHARMGRVTPYMSDEWMAAIKAAVSEAAAQGIAAWIYDEDGWPSGFGGGLVNELGEDYLQQYALAEVIECKGSCPPAVDDRDKILAAFTATKTDAGFDNVHRLDLGALASGQLDCSTGCDHLIVFRRELHNYRRYFAPEAWADGYVDVIDPKVTRAFLDKIYEPYKQEIGDEFGKTVLGVFTDEPSYHERDWMANEYRLPLTHVLEAEFEKRFGQPLIDQLMAIAFGGPDSIRARWCYYASLAWLFANNFTKILADWCAENDLQFTGHYLLEEYPRATTHVVGDPMLHYAYQQYPGIDHLGKGIDLRFDFWTSSRVLVKQAASVAHQLDKKRVMCETYAGGGWDFGISEQKWMGDWQYALGLNLCCQHAFHFTLRGFRKRDYPPSLSFQQPWYPISADLGSHFSRLGYLLTRGRRVTNVLVLHPIESFFATHDPAGFPWPDDELSDSFKAVVKHLLSSQIDFDFGNEVIMAEHGSVEGARINIGQGQYDVVIVPHSITWRKNTLAMLDAFVKAGGKLFFVEPMPTHVEGVPSDVIATLAAGATNLGLWDADDFERKLTQQVVDVAQPMCRLADSDPLACEVVMMHRRTNEENIFFLTSGAKVPHTSRATFDVPGVPMLLDTVSGELTAMAHTRDETGCHVELPFDFARSFPIVFDRKADETAPSQTCQVTKKLCNLGEVIDHRIDDENALILDKGELFIEGKSAGEVLTIDARNPLEKHGGTPKASIRFTFRSDVAVPNAKLLLETPELFDLTVNGQVVPTTADDGWLIDTALRRIVLPDGIQAGENVIEMRFTWVTNNIEIEPIYVVGTFGVDAAATMPRIIEQPDQLRVGSWHDQGLAFYAGRVTHTLHIDIDETCDRWELHIPEYRNAVRVVINGHEAGQILWAPHRLDVTQHVNPGANRIELQVAGSLRNFYGPHHQTREDDIECIGPQHFFETDTRTDAYRLKPAGLLGPAMLEGYSPDMQP